MTNDNSNDKRRPFLARVARYKAHIPGAVAGVVGERILGPPLDKMIEAASGIFNGSESSTPVATAPLPPPLPPPPHTTQTLRFDWPMDRASFRVIQYLKPDLHLQPDLYFGLKSDGSKPVSIKAMASGTVTHVFHVQHEFLVPMFGIFVRHAENLHSLYWGYGTSIVRPKMSVKKSQEIASLALNVNWLYFEMTQGQQFIDPRPYFPLLPRVSEIEAYHVISLPGVMYLWLWHCEVLKVDPNQIHAWRQQLQAEFARSLIPDDRR